MHVFELKRNTLNTTLFFTLFHMIQSYVGYPLDLRSPPEAGKDGEPKKVHTGKYSFTAHFPDVDDDFSAGC